MCFKSWDELVRYFENVENVNGGVHEYMHTSVYEGKEEVRIWHGDMLTHADYIKIKEKREEELREGLDEDWDSPRYGDPDKEHRHGHVQYGLR